MLDCFAKERLALTLFIFILLVLSLFWGTFFHVHQNLGSFVVWIVDFDGVNDSSGDLPVIGPALIQEVEKAIQSTSPHVGYGVLPASHFNNDPIEVRRAIYDYDAWAAIVINPNATSALRQALETGDASYDPTSACQVVYVEARDTVAVDTYIRPELIIFQTNALASISAAWTREVMKSFTTSTRANILASPQTLSPAIGFETINLRPFGPPTVTPAVTVGLIYLIILAFFSFAFFMPTHFRFLSQLGGKHRVYFGHLVIWKYVSTTSAYFFMSLAYSLVPLAFQIPFSNGPASHTEPALNPNAYGHASFFIYWMINFMGMCALGLACENVAMFIGQPYTAFWLIFWVISNVATSFYPIEVAPAFYTYGYAFPLHSIVEATKIILFDVHSTMGLHVGILLSWWAVNTAVFPLAAWWFRMGVLEKYSYQDLVKLAKWKLMFSNGANLI
jgi:hypothetical protein